MNTNETDIRVYVITGYAGVPKMGVYLGDDDYVLETSEVKEILRKMILEKGYTISQSKRQKYPRLTINA